MIQEPNLFNWAEPIDGEDNIQSEFAAIMRRETLKRQANPDEFFIIPPPELQDQAGRYYNTYSRNIQKALQESGATPTTQEGVLNDYKRTLAGIRTEATPEQMREALGCCPGLKAYTLERYAFFAVQMLSYSRYFNQAAGFENYCKYIKDAQARGVLLNIWRERLGNFPALIFQRLLYDKAAEFEAASKDVNPEAVAMFRKWAKYYGNAAYYSQYVFIAKYALNATEEQLKAIPTPPGFRNPLQSALLTCDNVADYLDRLAAKAAEALGATDRHQREAATEQLNQNIEAPPKIEIPNAFAAVLSRDIYANPTVGGINTPIFTITSLIFNYLKNHPEEMTTPEYVELALEGIWRLLQRGEGERQPDGDYTLNTNLSAFAEACGLVDAGEEQKRRLLAALGVLDKIFLAVWHPTGWVAERVFTLQRIGMSHQEKGNITMNFYKSSFVNPKRVQILSAEMFAKLRADSKRGSTKKHFAHQLLSKGHKDAEQLLDEVFGYSARLKEAEEREATPEEMKQIRRNIQQHRPRDRKRLQSWFDEYQDNGLIKYTFQNGVYSWVRTTEQKEGPDVPEN